MPTMRAHGAGDQEDWGLGEDENLDHWQNLRPAREQRRVGRPECRTLRERDKQIIDKPGMLACTRNFGAFVVRNLHL